MTDDKLKAIEARFATGPMLADFEADTAALVAEVRRLTADLAEARNQRNEAQQAGMFFGADNDRLRGLIKRVEWSGAHLIGGRVYSCPWCEAAFGAAEVMATHADCPAFTPTGEVK